MVTCTINAWLEEDKACVYTEGESDRVPGNVGCKQATFFSQAPQNTVSYISSTKGKPGRRFLIIL